jgi:hypothetical protein
VFEAPIGVPPPATYDSNKDYSSDDGLFGPYEGLFNKASYDHDLCYGSQIYAKSQCDEALAENLERDCDTDWKLWALVPFTGGLSEAGCQTAVSLTWAVVTAANHYKPRTSSRQP